VARRVARHVEVYAPVVVRVVSGRDEIRMQLHRAVAQRVQPLAQHIFLRCISKGNPQRNARAAVKDRHCFERRVEQQCVDGQRGELDPLELDARLGFE